MLRSDESVNLLVCIGSYVDLCMLVHGCHYGTDGKRYRKVIFIR